MRARPHGVFFLLTNLFLVDYGRRSPREGPTMVQNNPPLRWAEEHPIGPLPVRMPCRVTSLPHECFPLSYDDLKAGRCVGVDKYGNRYYQNTRYFIGQLVSLCSMIVRKPARLGRSRWVQYADRVGLDYDASQVPPEW